MADSAKHIETVKSMLNKSFDYLLAHDGAGKMEVFMKLLKRGQKEILIQCGRTYRFVVDMEPKADLSANEVENN